MGAGGVIVPPRTYFQKIQAVLKKYDVLMIADEVICGFGRTGNMWGCDTFGIQPDILVCAKALSASYLPISAVLVSDAVYQGIAEGTADGGPPFGHGYTYGGHPVSAAVAVETLKIYDEIDMIGHVKKISPLMQNGLGQFRDHPLVGEVRGVGMVAAIEVVEDKASKKAFAPARKIGPYIDNLARKNGMIVRAMGDSIGFTPPLIMKPAEINEMVEKMGKTLDQTWAAIQAGEI
jgi:4-aminobutyrate--pyruvate transaminase